MNKRFKILDYNTLTLQTLNEHRNKVVGINKEGIVFYLNLKLKDKNKNLVVFSNGAVNFKKSTPPVFSRSSWYKDFNANCIYIDDATIHNKGISVGWGVGETDRHFIIDYCEIIERIAELLEIEKSNIVFFGSSAGGFMSIMLSIYIKGSVAMANNPQVWVREESQEGRARNLYKSIFPNMSENEITDLYGERLSVIKAMEKEKYIPKIYYILNRYSKKDVIEQYRPFLDFIDSKENLDNDSEILLYHSSKGHSGVYSREQTAKLINGYFTEVNLSLNTESVNTKTFSVFNNNKEKLKEVNFENILYLPKEYIRKGYYASYTFEIDTEQGNLELTLLSSYLSKYSGNLYYDVYLNTKKVLTEDMGKWREPNVINISKLSKRDKIEIRVGTNKNNMYDSWTNASKLKILNVKIESTKVNLKQNIKCSSPYSKIYSLVSD